MSEIDDFLQFALAEANLELGTPATETEIADFESRYNIKFPADLREYFLKINGVYDWGGFYKIEALKDWCLLFEFKYNDPRYYRGILNDADNYFRFGCYDILVWQWLIKLDDSQVEPSIVVTHEKATRIAYGFSNFLRLYRQKNHDLWLGYIPEFYPEQTGITPKTDNQ
jgi:hypothetical protein